jgi:hypothetical protein
MSPLRIAFLLVFIVAAAAFFVARSAVSSFSLGSQVAQAPVHATQQSATPRPTLRPSPRPTQPAPAPTNPPATATPRPISTIAPAPTAPPQPSATVPAPRPTRAPETHAVAPAPKSHSDIPASKPHKKVVPPHMRKVAPAPHGVKKAPVPHPVKKVVAPHPAKKAPDAPKRQLALAHKARHPHSHEARPSPTPTPSPTEASGETTISNYWISQTAVRRGTTIAVGYTIDNGTGKTERVLLGASIKPSVVATWGKSVSDPFHDVVATVPPGITTHVRYFTLTRALRPGPYDVAWGLRAASNGLPVALVTAPDSLRVTR